MKSDRCDNSDLSKRPVVAKDNCVLPKTLNLSYPRGKFFKKILLVEIKFDKLGSRLFFLIGLQDGRIRIESQVLKSLRIDSLRLVRFIKESIGI